MSRKESHTTLEYIVGFIIVLPFIVGFSALGAWIFMLLWNWVLAGIFPAVPVLDFWRAWGLSTLLSIFGGFFKSSR